jgi:hypothetical protein
VESPGSISDQLQRELERRGLDEVPAVEAARWLDSLGLLRDSGARPGKPLRDLLRAGLIAGAERRPPALHGRWFITRVRPTSHLLTVPETPPRASVARSTASTIDARLRDQRSAAARRFQPDRVKLLLVAEAPPSAPDRYFYFADVSSHDSLFRYVARAILDMEPTRMNKAELLTMLRDRGVFLIDVLPDPVSGQLLSSGVPALVERVRNLAPDKVILIKATVFDAAYTALVDAGLPVVDIRIPFPGSGQQRRFEKAFAEALTLTP